MTLFRVLKALVAEVGSWVYALFVTADPDEDCEHPDAGEGEP